ncbi:MAG: hypothetical protein MUF03_02435 [Rubrivivax sp.]|jgi:hypothetical protein|nr:hypothetical protein [Rubrivivax sp.]
MTVHGIPVPDLSFERRRTRTGRLKMLLVLLACASPVIASYFTYFVIRPEGRTNYGELVQPPREMPKLAASTLDGAAVDLTALRGQWLLVAVGPSACDPGCEQRLYTQRQLREMLGRDRDRLDKVWLVTDDGPVAAPLRAALEAAPPVTVLRVDGEGLARWLDPAAGRRLDEHLYVVDPMGMWMMRVPADPEPRRVHRDLARVLRASASWDQAGR